MAERMKIVAVAAVLFIVLVAGALVPVATAEIVVKGEEAPAAGSTDVTSMPGFAALKAGCLRACDDGSFCSTGKKPCYSDCDKVCHTRATGLAYGAKMYASTPEAEKKALIEAIDRHDVGQSHKMALSAAQCLLKYGKLCERDPACIALSQLGCQAKTVYALATPADFEAVKKAEAGKPAVVGTAV